MRLSRAIPITLLSAAVLAGCKTKQAYDTLAMADSLHADSLAGVRKELLDEVIASTQFMNDINTELGKARSLAIEAKNTRPGSESESENGRVLEQRKEIVGRISMLVSRLDGVQARLASTQARAQQMAQKDSTLLAQVVAYQQTVTELQQTAEKQRAEFQAALDGQKVQIASLTGQVDTLTQVRAALLDTVTRMTSERNTAYYVVGTRDELIKKGILVAEGQKRFFILGSRSIVPARQLDPAAFTKIDRLSDRTIDLPAGEYQIITRQSPAFVAPEAMKNGKIVGPLSIQQPEQFWEPSPFLIIVKG